MLENVYWLVINTLSYLGLEELLVRFFPQLDQISALSSYDFFYVTIVIIAIFWVLYAIVSLAIRFFSYLLGVILNG